MFTPLMLVCTMELCLAVSGPAAPDNETCQEALPFIVQLFQQRFPDRLVVDAKCVSWGEAT
jgi:hypothetical protein